MKLSSEVENVSGSISTFLIKSLYGRPYISIQKLFQFGKMCHFRDVPNLVVRHFKFAKKSVTSPVVSSQLMVP
jgi:hypothetical protein